MWNRNQRRGAAWLLLRRLGLLVLLVLVIIAADAVWGVYKKEGESQILREHAESQREDLLKRRSQLEAEIADLKSDRGLEEALREQYSLAVEGERLIVIVDSEEPETGSATSTFVDKLRSFFWFW
jgi:cell division protein FtsB